jgi:hypothetical protein
MVAKFPFFLGLTYSEPLIVAPVSVSSKTPVSTTGMEYSGLKERLLTNNVAHGCRTGKVLCVTHHHQDT